MSLLGLVRHLAEEERHLRRVMAGEDAPKLYRTDEDRDGDWNGAIADPAVVEDAWRQWRAEVELTDQFVAGVADLGTRNAGVSDLGPERGGTCSFAMSWWRRSRSTRGTAATPISCASASTAASASKRHRPRLEQLASPAQM